MELALKRFVNSLPLSELSRIQDNFDNGSEFSNPQALEFDAQGNRRLRVFYCESSSPYQKGGCENNHEMIRRIIPKGVDFTNYTQEDINLMMSHINSYSRAKHGNKSSYDIFAFQYGKKILKSLGIQKKFNRMKLP